MAPGAGRRGRVVTRIRVSVANGGRSVSRQLLIPVDAGSVFLILPRRVLESLGIEPVRRATFFIDGRGRLDREVGIATVRYRGVLAGTEVIFGEAGDLCGLGLVPLKQLGLEVNPRSGRIRKAVPPLLPFRTTREA